MEKDLHDFLVGAKNAVRTTVIISREQAPGGAQYISISRPEGGNLYKFWYKPGRNQDKDQPPPKHTGGRKPYIMLMVDEVERLRAKGVANTEELIGCLVSLGKNIEWSTGRLVHKRSKKALRYKDLQALFGYGNKRLNRILGELKEHELLFSTSDGYVVSRALIKKGNAARNKEDGR